MDPFEEALALAATAQAKAHAESTATLKRMASEQQTALDAFKKRASTYFTRKLLEDLGLVASEITIDVGSDYNEVEGSYSGIYNKVYYTILDLSCTINDHIFSMRITGNPRDNPTDEVKVLFAHIAPSPYDETTITRTRVCNKLDLGNALLEEQRRLDLPRFQGALIESIYIWFELMELEKPEPDLFEKGHVNYQDETTGAKVFWDIGRISFIATSRVPGTSSIYLSYGDHFLSVNTREELDAALTQLDLQLDGYTPKPPQPEIATPEVAVKRSQQSDEGTEIDARLKRLKLRLKGFTA